MTIGSSFMRAQATGTVTSTSWDEQPYNEPEGALKLTHASVVNTFAGDIQGEGTLAYLMYYRSEQYAGFIGLEQVVGSLGGQTGAFVLEHSGTFENGVVRASWRVTDGSGTGALAGLRGDGDYLWDGEHGNSVTYTLNYAFE
jgi:hypothetical protein